MSKSHHMYMSFLVYKQTIESHKFKDEKLKPIMLLLAKIFALKQLSLDSIACYESGFFSTGANNLLLETMKFAVTELRPYMIGLVELDSDEL
jgi:Acyl-CoA oxidase